MSKRKEIIALLIVDTVQIVLSVLGLYLVGRFFNVGPALWRDWTTYAVIQFSVVLYWVLIFLLAGLYRSWYRLSWLDEIFLLFKAVCTGIVFLLLFVSIEFVRVSPLTPTKLIIMVYALILFCLLVLGRTSVRTFQKKLLQHGIGRRRTVIVGWNERAHDLCKQVRSRPDYGYDVVGFVSVNEESAAAGPGKISSNPGDSLALKTYDRLQAELKTLERTGWSHEFSPERDVLGTADQLLDILEREKISVVLLSLDPREHDLLVRIITYCDEFREIRRRPLSVKIIPDLYSIISGQARTTQIEGIPLIELETDIMPPWELVTKRAMDIAVSSLILVGLWPLWVAIAVAIKLNSRGPVFYWQERIGRHGKPYQIVKFRSMRVDAEVESGPALASKDDPRVTPVGRWLRKTRLDEFPQFYNVLKGEMSIVGPRPERAHFIRQIVKKAPHYIHLHRVKPGITSLGQVRFGYAENVDEMIERSKYDILYIENMSLKLDLKIILRTVYVMLMGRGQ